MASDDNTGGGGGAFVEVVVVKEVVQQGLQLLPLPRWYRGVVNACGEGGEAVRYGSGRRLCGGENGGDRVGGRGER